MKHQKSVVVIRVCVVDLFRAFVACVQRVCFTYLGVFITTREREKKRGRSCNSTCRASFYFASLFGMHKNRGPLSIISVSAVPSSQDESLGNAIEERSYALSSGETEVCTCRFLMTLLAALLIKEGILFQ